MLKNCSLINFFIFDKTSFDAQMLIHKFFVGVGCYKGLRYNCISKIFTKKKYHSKNLLDCLFI